MCLFSKGAYFGAKHQLLTSKRWRDNNMSNRYKSTYDALNGN